MGEMAFVVLLGDSQLFVTIRHFRKLPRLYRLVTLWDYSRRSAGLAKTTSLPATTPGVWVVGTTPWTTQRGGGAALGPAYLCGRTHPTLAGGEWAGGRPNRPQHGQQREPRPAHRRSDGWWRRPKAESLRWWHWNDRTGTSSAAGRGSGTPGRGTRRCAQDSRGFTCQEFRWVSPKFASWTPADKFLWRSAPMSKWAF